MSDMISRAAAIGALMEAGLAFGYGEAVDIIRALPAVEVGVKPECGHPFCGDKCGTATPAQDCREHSGDTDCSVTAYAALAAERDAALRERDEAEFRETLAATKAVEYLDRAEKSEAEAAALRKEVERLRGLISGIREKSSSYLTSAMCDAALEDLKGPHK